MNIIEKSRDGLLYYQFERFNQIDYVTHLFTSRIGWNNKNMSEKLSKFLDMPRFSQVNLQQVHGTNIILIDDNDENFEEISNSEGDGLITKVSKVILSTNHADCVPIYFIDQATKSIGVAHGGWKGTYGNITGKMIDKMRNVYGSDVKDILVGIGPSIGPCCYEIGQDLGEKFKEKFPDFPDILISQNSRLHLDLWKMNYLQARKKGVEDKNIIVSRACTSCNVDKFHSYRREGGTKERLVAAIALKG